MKWSSTLHSILASSETDATPGSESLDRADELLELIKSPTAIATIILLGFAGAQLKLNSERSFQTARTIWALLASVGAVIITLAITAVMAPLTWRMLFENDGPVETLLLVYGLTHVVAIGTACYSASVVWQCCKELMPAGDR